MTATPRVPHSRARGRDVTEAGGDVTEAARSALLPGLQGAIPGAQGSARSLTGSARERAAADQPHRSPEDTRSRAMGSSLPGNPERSRRYHLAPPRIAL